MKVVGVILILVGIFALAYRGISYTHEHKVLDVGPIEAKVNEKKTIPLSPILGGLAVAAGIVLVLSNRRQRA